MTLRARISGLACAAAVAVALCAAPAQADAPFQRGFVLTGWNAASYLTPQSDTKLKRMATDGSSQAAVFTQWFMDAPTSSHLAPDAARTPTDAGILHAIETARTAGMAVTVKPQVGIRTGSWIGAAHPADLDAFWSDYRTMLLHYADLAEQGGASILVIGTEMGTLSPDGARWRSLIAEVRTHFSGELTYAANYDEFQRVPFWDALDYIGIDAYFGLAEDADPAPPADALTAAWTDRGYLERIRAVSERAGRKVLFTEIGYRGTHATAAHPNAWSGTQVTDTAAQANAYEAFYRAVSGQPWMAGLYWWEVNADAWWVQDYSPLAKPAEQVMIEWNKRLAPAPPVVNPPPVDTPPLVESPPVETPPIDTPPVDIPPATDTQPPQTDPQPPVEQPQPQAEPVTSQVTTAVETATTVVVTEVAPQKAADNSSAAPPLAATQTVAPIPKTAMTLKLSGRRLSGAVTPYSPACSGQVQLRVRIKRAGKWRYLRPPAPLSLAATGAFSNRMGPGRLRVKAVFASGCATASSPWVTTAP